MNGFVSLNAAITMHGHKLSLPAQAPAGAFFDLSILGAAPPRLLRAGLGDSLCRTTAQADWLMAHLLFDTPYRELPFDLLADDEAPLFAGAAELMRGDPEVVERLVNTLVLAGFGTAIVGNSQPASQGEHLVSHFIDMFADAGPAAGLPRRAGRRHHALGRAAAGADARGARRASAPMRRRRRTSPGATATSSAARAGRPTGRSGSTRRRPRR